MQNRVGTDLLGVTDIETHIRFFKHPGVTGLTTRLGIERCLLQHNHTLLTFLQAICRLTVMKQRDDPCVFCEMFITGKRCADVQVQLAGIRGMELAGGTRAFTLRIHFIFEPVGIECQVSFTGNVCRKVKRETIGIVKLEYGLAGDHCALQFTDRRFEYFHTLIQRLGKAFFFSTQNTFNLLTYCRQFRIGIAHLVTQWANEFIEKCFSNAELVTVTNRATNNTAQYITATFVGRDHSIDNEETTGPNVIGDHTQGGLLQVIGADELCHCAQEVLEQVDVIVLMTVLQNSRKAFQTHTRINRRCG